MLVLNDAYSQQSSKMLVALCLKKVSFSIMPLYIIYTKYSIFKAVKKQSSTRFIVDALFDNFAYLHSLYTVVELHTNFVLIHFGRQLMLWQLSH